MPATSLAEMAKRAAIRNVAVILDVGDMPYDILRPVLRKITNPQQLHDLEVKSPHIADADAELWHAFIARDISPNTNTKVSPKNPRSWWKVYRKLLQEDKATNDILEKKLSTDMAAARKQIEDQKSTFDDRIFAHPVETSYGTKEVKNSRKGLQEMMGVKRCHTERLPRVNSTKFVATAPIQSSSSTLSTLRLQPQRSLPTQVKSTMKGSEVIQVLRNQSTVAVTYRKRASKPQKPQQTYVRKQIPDCEDWQWKYFEGNAKTREPWKKPEKIILPTDAPVAPRYRENIPIKFEGPSPGKKINLEAQYREQRQKEDRLRALTQPKRPKLGDEGLSAGPSSASSLSATSAAGSPPNTSSPPRRAVVGLRRRSSTPSSRAVTPPPQSPLSAMFGPAATPKVPSPPKILSPPQVPSPPPAQQLKRKRPAPVSIFMAKKKKI